MSAAWKEAYAAMHNDGRAAFPPACLHYVLERVRRAGREHAGGLPPDAIIADFRRAVRADFGPLFREVLEDWELRDPADLGRAVTLLGNYHCIQLDSGDTPEHFATDTVPFSKEEP